VWLSWARLSGRFWQITGGNESVEAVKEAWIKLETCEERFSYLE